MTKYFRRHSVEDGRLCDRPQAGGEAALDETRDNAEIGRATPYYLRHSFASLLIWEGKPISYVAAQLGHSPQMTLRTYTHVIDELVDTKPMSAEEAIRKARRKIARKEKKAA